MGLDGFIGIVSSIPLQIYLSQGQQGQGNDHQLILLRDCLTNYSFPEFFAVAMWVAFVGFFVHLFRLALWFKITDYYYYYYYSYGKNKGEGEEEEKTRKEEEKLLLVEKLSEVVLTFLELGIGFASSIPLQIGFGLFYTPDHAHQQDCSRNHSFLEYVAILLSILLSSIFLKKLCLACWFKIKDRYSSSSTSHSHAKLKEQAYDEDDMV